MVVGIISSLLFLAYTGLIFYYWSGWKSLKPFTSSEPLSFLKFSIIIPARNEEKNIGNLLEALKQQDYPADRFEVIVINDNSTDKTAEIVATFSSARLIELPTTVKFSHKKKAIELGIANAHHDWIITTDADCIPPKNWLRTIASFQNSTNAVFIAAPVMLTRPIKSNYILYVFQLLDFSVLQGVTAASVHKQFHTMCNGANIAYEKEAFTEVGGFSGIDKVASGDDMLLMYKIWKKYPDRVRYLKSKSAIVETAAANSWKNFLQQRIRWASKARHYDDKRIFFALLLVYLFNFLFLVLLIAGFWIPFAWIVFLALWLLKTIVEFPFVFAVTRFFGKLKFMGWFLFFQPLHIFYTIVSGLLGQFSYEWKGRKVK